MTKKMDIYGALQKQLTAKKKAVKIKVVKEKIKELSMKPKVRVL